MATKATMVTLMPIKKMDRAIKFYTKVLGAKLNMRAPGEMKNFWASISFGKVELWLIVPSSNEKRKLAYNALSVKNIKKFVAELQKKGVKFQKAERMGENSRVEGVITWEDFGGSAFFQDTEGNVLMAWQNIPAM